MNSLTRVMTAGLVCVALVGTGATAAVAADDLTAHDGSALISVAELNDMGFSDAEIEAAVASSPYVSIEEGPIPSTGEISTQGVTFGKFIYVRISQAQAKALNAATSTAAAGIIGLATGGVGAVIATVVYAYVGSMNDSALSRCARWEFRLSYPLPNVHSRILAANCY